MVPPGDRRGPRADRRHLVADRDRRDHDLARCRASPRPSPGSAQVAAARHQRRRGRRDGRSRCRTARAATWCSPSRGRRCCAASGATTSASSRPTGHASTACYFAGDGAKKDEDGDIWLLGRVDDVMNVSGHRLSTTEIESALVSHPMVAEAAVVGATDETTGQAVVAFVILRGEYRDRVDEPARAATSPPSCARTSPRRSARSPSRARSWWSPSCPRPGRARSCAGCCATSPSTATVGDVTTLADSSVMDADRDGSRPRMNHAGASAV